MGWLDLALPLLGLAAVAGLIGWRRWAHQRQQRALRRAFGQYLNPAVVDRVLADPSMLAPGGEEKVLTVLFADLRDSTGVAGALGPTAFLALLNELFAMMNQAIVAHDGMLDKYLGDGLIAVFGAPLARPDHPLLACRAALAIADGLPALRARWERPGLPTLDIGIGINTGPMIIGNLGSAERFDYTVIGDEVSLAQRLEAANRDLGTRTLISAATRREVWGEMAVRDVAEIGIRGLGHTVRAFELLGRLPLDPAEEKRIRLFESALAAFQERDWERADALFERSLAENPDDRPAWIYLDRCAEQLNRLS
jgi:adenylate cyclase